MVVPYLSKLNETRPRGHSNEWSSISWEGEGGKDSAFGLALARISLALIDRDALRTVTTTDSHPVDEKKRASEGTTR